MRRAGLHGGGGGGGGGGCCVTDVWISAEKKFAFVELRLERFSRAPSLPPSLPPSL